MSGRGAGCCDPGSPTATDDHGLVPSKVKVVTVPTQPAFPGRELRVGNGPGGTEGKHSAPLQG